jgi:patatin-related protein
VTDPAATKELRLALVLYGGLSLAIYMHGITKELHKLVAASRALDDSDGKNPFPPATTEHVYWDALDHLRKETGVRTGVVVDIVSGTSAGGINGIYLAKALAENVLQDELRNLWIEKGDIAGFTRGRAVGRGKARLLLPVLRALLHGRENQPVLRGDVMSRWFLEALEGMDGRRYVEGLETLMPENHELQLFITTTDLYGYERELPLEDPRVITDLRHRHVFEFRRGRTGVPDRFRGPDYNYALAFAARATSSFPGAFPAVSFHDFEEYFDPPISLGAFAHEFCRIYELSGWSASNTYFVDGGVLNNYPFDHAIRAIRTRRASGEVERRLLYVQPDPRRPTADRGKEPEPGWIASFARGAAAIPQKEPILDDLLNVMQLNERVRTIREIIESSFDDVQRRLEKLLGSQPLEHFLASADDAALQALRDEATDKANAEVGHGYTTYVRTKIRSVVDDFADLVNSVCDYPDESNHAFFVRAVASAWADEAGLFAREPYATTEQKEFLQTFDLEYTHRLLRFLIAALSWWYRDIEDPKVPTPTRDQLGRAKVLLYDHLGEIERFLDGEKLEDELKERLRAVFDQQAIADALRTDGLDPASFLAGRGEELGTVRDQLAKFLHDELDDFAPKLTAKLRELTEDWVREPRRDFFVRYLGFAYWDVLLFPVQFLAEAGERDSVAVMRASPFDSRLLHPPDQKKGKLKGTALHHFGAFFGRPDRENDYLWGRLDGAERLLVLLLGSRDLECAKRCADAFEAILTEESTYLTTVEGLVGSVRAQLPAIRELAETADEALEGQTLDLEPRDEFALELNRVLGEEVARVDGGAETLAQAQERLRTLLQAVLADTEEKSPRRRFAKAGRPHSTT